MKSFNLHGNIPCISSSQLLFHLLVIALSHNRVKIMFMRLFMVPVATISTDNHSVYLFIYIIVFDTVKSDCMEY